MVGVACHKSRVTEYIYVEKKIGHESQRPNVKKSQCEVNKEDSKEAGHHRASCTKIATSYLELSQIFKIGKLFDVTFLAMGFLGFVGFLGFCFMPGT